MNPLTPSERQQCVEALESCACFGLRKSSRAVTRLFDEALEPSGLRSTQLVVLLQVAAEGAPCISRLAREMVMDASTVARNLKPLERDGLVIITTGPDRRRKSVSITAEGARRIREAVPHWLLAHNNFIGQFGKTRWQDLRKNLTDTVRAARAAAFR